MSTPFQPRDVPRPTLLDKLFRRAKPDSAEAELRTLFALTPIAEIDRANVAKIFDRHRVDERARARVQEKLWRHALTALADDNELTDTECDFLADLRSRLEIGEDTVIRAEAEILHPKYEALVRRVVADRVITDAERGQIERAAKALHLSPRETEAIYRKAASELLQSTLDAAIADQRLSPTEFREYSLLAQRLGIDPRLDEPTKARLHRYALLWRIENGEMPTVPVPINLQRGEVCHFRGGAAWHEMRTRTERVGYSGTSVSIPIVKGVRYRVSSYRPQRVTRQELTQIDVGDFYITNKRVVFDGVHKNSAIRYSSLLGVTPYTDGIKLEKSSGRSSYLLFDGDVEMVTVILSSAMAQG